jgi:hypothetical protein
MQNQTAINVKLLTVAMLLSCIFFSIIGSCNAQLSEDLVITHTEVGWTADMLHLSPPMTTPEIGFKVQITLKNTGNQPIMVGYQRTSQQAVMLDSLTIDIQLKSVDTPTPCSEFKQIVYNYQNPLTIEPNQSINTSVIYFYDLSSQGGSLQIGSYKAEIMWYPDNNNYQTNQVEKYPFNFEVASESLFQDTLKANTNTNGGFVLNIDPINFTLIDAGLATSITVLSLGGLIAYIRKKKKKK